MQRSGNIRVLENQVSPMNHIHAEHPARSHTIEDIEKAKESHMKNALIYTIILIVLYIELYHSKVTK